MENKKTVEDINISSNNKVMSVIMTDTLREMINIVNDNHIKKSDIVTLLKEREYFALVYYK